MLDWKIAHSNVINQFLKYLNTQSNGYVLKGGTALMMCYGLTRFSEDIDLDGMKTDIQIIVDEFCKMNDYKYSIVKNTDTVKSFMINYGNVGKPLKIEVSYRTKNISPQIVCRINNILVYDINSMITFKISAYTGRDKIRDLFDVVFIGLKYWGQLSEQSKLMMRNAIAYKGIEHFDYIIKIQSDELINNDELAINFLKLWNMLGLR